MLNPLLDRRLLTPRTAVLAFVTALCLIFPLTAMRAFSQAATGTLSGTVYDLSGGTVSATVTVTNPVSGRRDSANSDASGVYTFPQLPAGRYDVETWAAGFAGFQFNSITIGANQEMTLNIVLTPPSLAAANVPQQVEVSGTMTITVEDDFETGRSSIIHTLSLPAKPGQDPATISVTPADDRGPYGFVTGDRVTFRGFLSGNVLSDASVKRVDSRDPQPESLASALASGNHTTLVLSLRSSASAPSCSASTMNEVFFTNSNSVAAFFPENSYGSMTLSGIVLGPYTVDAQTNCNKSRWTRQADAAATAAGVNLNDYQHLVYMLPAESETQCIGWSGQAEIGGKRSWIRGGFNNGHLVCTSNHTIAHELGHNIGALHASTPADIPGGDPATYGDASSTMGGTLMNSTAENPHFNAPQKAQMGWISGAAIQTVSASGPYAMSPLHTPAGVVKTLKVPVPESTTDSYYVSYRVAEGLFDGNLAPQYLNKTSVHRWSGSGNTYLLANLADGESFNESGIMIKQDSNVPTSAYVTVTLGAPTPPDTTAPTAPTNLTAKFTGQKVNLNWAASSDNTGVIGYDVYRNNVKIASTTSTTYSDSTTTSGGGTYTYYVVAFDAAGNISASSNTASIVR